LNLKRFFLLPKRIYPEDDPWQRTPRWYLPVATALVMLLVVAGAVLVLVGPKLDEAEVSAPVAFLGSAAMAGAMTAVASQVPTREGRFTHRLMLILLFVMLSGIFFVGCFRVE